MVATVATGALLLLACLGTVGGYFLLPSSHDAAPGAPGAPAGTSQPPTGAVDPSQGTNGGPEEDGDPGADGEGGPLAEQGPGPSGTPANDIFDLNRVCDGGVYYPQSPRRAGKAPHPVALLVWDGTGVRYQDSTYYFSQGLSKAVERTWAPKDPMKVQMVACLDRVSAGSKIRNCKYDTPKPMTAALFRAGWRLRVYEVTTGRKLMDRAIPGDDQQCPYVVMIQPDKKIYAGVSDGKVVAALRNLVKK